MKNSLILAATPNLEKSLDFYRKLDFTLFENHGRHFAVDGSYIIEISDEKFVRSGVKLYKENWDNEVEALKDLTAIEKVDGGYVLSGPSGIWISLREGDNPDVLEIEVSNNSKLGSIAGLSLEGISIPSMYKIWKQLGFEKSMGNEDGGWMVAQNGDGFGVSLMKINSCPHSFYNPSLTYFNGKENLKIIENIRAAGIDITEEITEFNPDGIVDNVIIRDPGGFGFFIFSD